MLGIICIIRADFTAQEQFFSGVGLSQSTTASLAAAYHLETSLCRKPSASKSRSASKQQPGNSIPKDKSSCERHREEQEKGETLPDTFHTHL